jgi:transposase
MSQPNNLRRCHTTLDQDSSLIAVVEMSQSSWLVAGIVPGISRQPAKKLKPDQTALLGLLRRWQDEAAKGGWACRSVTSAVTIDDDQDQL